MNRVFTITLLIITILLASGCSPTASTTPASTAPPVSPQSVPTEKTLGDSDVKIVLYDQNHTSNGLYLDAGGDVDTELVTFGSPQEHAFRTGNGQVLPSSDGNMVQDWYMQFQVDDDFIYQGAPTSHVQIEIEYLDEGTDNFNIQYDALSGGETGDGRFKESEVITKTGSGEFKTAVFTLSDAYFANRDNGADFRISDHSDGAETILRVTVTLLTPSTEMSQSPTDIPLPPPDTLPENQANMIFYNGIILTMEDGIITTALAIKNGRIMDTGSDEQILEYAGPGTTLIDLEGHTLMPGFVDAHSHVLNNPWRADLEEGQEYVLANGITTSAELFVEEDLLREILTLERDGKLRLRVSLYPVHVDNCGNIRGPWYREDFPVTREPGAMVQIPGVKLFNDGGSCNLPAVSFEYPDGKGHGDLYFTVDELSEIIVEVQSYGYQVAIHGLGDRAIEVNQDAIEAALAGSPNAYRHRIEHNTLLRDEMLTRYSEIGIVPVIFATFPTCFFIDDPGQFKGSTPDEYLYWEWRWRDLIDANPDVHIAWHSDGESDPWPINPFISLHRFVTRKQKREDGTFCKPPDWAADDLLTMEEALPMMTIESAYALLREDEIGSLRAGKLADLIILSDNPMEVDHDSILDIQVLMTMVGGQVEHCIQGQENLCPGFPAR